MGGRGLVWTLEKCRITAPTGNTTLPFRNLVACLIIFPDPLSSYGSYSENQRQAVALVPASIEWPAICIRNTHQQPLRPLCQFCSLTDAYRDILLSHHGCHWIFCGWMDACYKRHIGKTENKIADCSNATVSDGFYNFNRQMQTTVIYFAFTPCT